MTLVELDPENLRIDVARILDSGRCAVRVTHHPGTTVSVDDQPSTEANRQLAIARVADELSFN